MNLCFCQNKNVSAVYGLSIQNFQNFQDPKETPVFFADLFHHAKIDCKKLSFDLIATKKESKFSYQQILEGNANIKSLGFTLAMSIYSGKIYTLKDLVYNEIEILGQNTFCKNEITKNWTITSESKQIGDYLCYKATNIYHVDNGLKVFNHPVTAWFCPEIPFPFGPIGYGNLPGLILELKVRNVTYTMKEIYFDTNIYLNLPDFSSCTVLSEKELDEALDKFNGFK